MKYLYYDEKIINPKTIKLKKKNETIIIENNELSIKECFNLKETNEYEIIEIQAKGLFYKTKKTAKKRFAINDKCNLIDFEYGGIYRNLGIVNQIKFYISETQKTNAKEQDNDTKDN